jgi:tetratricopeptide (TPR) repeat protein
LGRFDKALPNSLEAVKLAPDNYLAYSDAAMSYLGLNRPADAKAILQEAERRKIGGFYLHQQLGDIAIVQQDSAALAKEDALAKANPEGELNLLGRDGSLAARHGRLRQARELFAKSSALATRLDLKELALNNMAYLATFDSLIGSHTEALQLADKILVQSQTPTDQLNLADIYARAGREDKALQLMREATDKRAEDTMVQNVTLPMIHATIAMNHGDAAKAVDILKAAENYDAAQAELLYTRGYAYLRAGQSAQSVAEFKRVLNLGAYYSADPIISLAQLGLARAYASAGDKQQARTAYEDFLSLWKDADPDLLILKQAKAEYSKL